MQAHYRLSGVSRGDNSGCSSYDEQRQRLRKPFVAGPVVALTPEVPAVAPAAESKAERETGGRPGRRELRPSEDRLYDEIVSTHLQAVLHEALYNNTTSI